jgi:hypothetical protein
VVGNAPHVRLDSIKAKIAQIAIGSKQLKGYFLSLNFSFQNRENWIHTIKRSRLWKIALKDSTVEK